MEIATKITGGTLDANEFNQIPDELENTISSTGQAPSSGDLFQVSKAISDYAANGDFYTDSGVADSYVLSVIGSKQAPTAYGNGTRVRFVVGNANTGASTINVATLGAKSIKRANGSALSASDMIAGEIVELQYDGTDFLLNKETLTIGSIRDVSRSLLIQNNVTNPNFQIDITADEVMMENSFGGAMRALSVSKVIDITASGVDGLDTGSEANSTWYHTWVIGKADGTIGSLLSLSSTTPTMPAGYTFKALMGAIYNDSGGDFITIVQEGRIVRRSETTVLTNGSATSSTVVDISAFVPPTAKRIMGSSLVFDGSTTTSSWGFIQDQNSLNRVRNRAVVINITAMESFEASSELYYEVGQATTDLTIHVSGWKY